MTKRRLLFFFNGLPEFEVMFYIALRLKERGIVQPVCFCPSEVLRREPRLKPMVEMSNLNITTYPSRWLKFFPKKWLKQGEVAMTMVDPTLDKSPNRSRSVAILEMGMPTIFIQHGVMQGRLNLFTGSKNIRYISEILLIFEKIITPEVLSLETHKKTQIVGFIKPMLFPPRPPKKPLPKHDRVILFCHSFRWKGRYGKDDVSRFYNLVGKFAANHPDDLIIIRSHRAKSRALYRSHDKALSKIPNIIFSHAYKGPLKGMSMTDVLELSDMCISTASTAILDSVYMNKPTAIYENDQPVFPTLPNVTGLDSLESFVSNPDISDIAGVQSHYGQIENNIERCCEVIENTMQKL